jgi:peptide/nickel transport system substrate-binding protein
MPTRIRKMPVTTTSPAAPRRAIGNLGVVAALLIVAMVTGCVAAPATDAEAPSGLRLAIGGEPDDGFDPTFGWGRYGSPLFQSTLLRLDADLEIGNDLATSHEVSADGRTWTVTIRDDAVFTDDTPLTARDVAYTFNTAKRQPGLTDVSGLVRAEATSDTVVEFTLDAPRSTFVYRLASLGIVPEHAHGPDYGERPIGSGPFVLVEWDRGRQLVVERNERYYGTKPAFDRVVFVFTDEDGTLAAARAGQLHLASVPPTLVGGDVPGMRLEAVPSTDNRGIVFPYVGADGATTADGRPIGNDVTADKAIRQAVNMAVDRQELVEAILLGYGSAATGPAEGTPWHEPASQIDDDDLPGATRLLEESGWTDTDGDGIREKNGVSAAFTLLYPAADTLRQSLSVAVAGQVRAAGIRIDPKAAGWPEIEQRMHADPVMFGWGSHDPTEIFNLYHSRNGGVEYWNPGFYGNPTVDRHLEKALSSLDQESANTAWRAAQLDERGDGFSASADAAWAWLVNVDHTYYVDTCLDLGDRRTEPHGHGWPITAGIAGWTWTC